MIDVQSAGTYFNNNEEEITDFKYMWNLTSQGTNLVVLITNLISNEFFIRYFDESSLNDVVEFKILFTNKSPSEIVYSSNSIP